MRLGFLLGPRVNAGGRIGQADLGARLLATDEPAEAAALAERLDLLNTERRDIEARVREEALAQAEARGLDGPLVWAAGEGWHPGVVGIVAARLKEATHRPAVVIGFDGTEGKGSARSVTGVDLGAAIQRVAAEGLLIKGGGHKMAAGLTVARDKLEAAMERLGELLAKQGAGAGGREDLRIDSLLMPTAATPGFVEQIEAAGPFGAAAPAPRFAFADTPVTTRRVGDSAPQDLFRRRHGPANRRHRLRCLRHPAWPGAGRRRPSTLSPRRAAGAEHLGRTHQGATAVWKMRQKRDFFACEVARCCP